METGFCSLPGRRFVGAFLLFIGAALGALADASLPDPEKPGPYPVGVTTMLFVDHLRPGAAGEPRSLPTEIWYPAADETRGLPKNHLLDFFGKGKFPEMAVVFQIAAKADLMALDRTFRNFAVRDARPCDGLFPLVLFSHGNGGIRSQSVFLCEHLASHGYIVVAPDHTGNSLITAVNGTVVIFNDTDEGRQDSSKQRPADLSFLIDTMDRLNKGGDSRFFGRIDIEHIAVTGHSFGGFTSTWMADTDPRVDAIIPMAGVARTRTRYDCPALVLMASEDDTLGIEGNNRIRQYYEESKGPKYFVEFKNGGHYSFTEMFQFSPAFGDGIGTGVRITDGQPVTYTPMEIVYPLVNGYSTAFLGRYLKGLTGYDAGLSCNHNPDELIVKSE